MAEDNLINNTNNVLRKLKNESHVIKRWLQITEKVSSQIVAELTNQQARLKVANNDIGKLSKIVFFLKEHCPNEFVYEQ